MEPIFTNGLQSKLFTGESQESQEEANKKAQEVFDKWLEDINRQESLTYIKDVQFRTNSSGTVDTNEYNGRVPIFYFTSSIFILYTASRT